MGRVRVACCPCHRLPARRLAGPPSPEFYLCVARLRPGLFSQGLQVVHRLGPRQRGLVLASTRLGLLRPSVLEGAFLGLQVHRLEATATLEAFLAGHGKVCRVFLASFVEHDLRRRRRAVPVLVHRPAERVFLLPRNLEVRVYGSASVHQVRPVVPLVVPGARLVIPRPQVVVLVDRLLARVQRLRRFLGSGERT